MNSLSDKIEYLSRIAGVDLRIEKENRADCAVDKNGRKYFSVSCDDKKVCISVPKNTDGAIIALICAYFSDLGVKNGGDDQSVAVYRLISGIAASDEIVRLDKKISGKKYLVVLLVTNDPEKWSELVSYLDALSSKEDCLVKCDLNSALYLKAFDGSYDCSEELAEVLFDGITGDRKMQLVACSGGFACGSDGILSAYSRTLAAYRLCPGRIRHYRDCALVDLMRKVPEKDLRAFIEYLSPEKEEGVLADMLKDTAAAFLSNNLNLTDTAKKLFLHRNTMTGRLNKIEEITGTDIRSFRGAELYDLLNAAKIALGEK